MFMHVVPDSAADSGYLPEKVDAIGGLLRWVAFSPGLSVHVVRRAVPSSPAQLWHSAGHRSRHREGDLRPDAGPLLQETARVRRDGRADRKWSGRGAVLSAVQRGRRVI